MPPLLQLRMAVGRIMGRKLHAPKMQRPLKQLGQKAVQGGSSLFLMQLAKEGLDAHA